MTCKEKSKKTAPLHPSVSKPEHVLFIQGKGEISSNFLFPVAWYSVLEGSPSQLLAVVLQMAQDGSWRKAKKICFHELLTETYSGPLLCTEKTLKVQFK